MATVEPDSCVKQIGEAAGKVWRELHDGGPMSMTRLVKAVGEPRDAVLQAVGWLAREGKISIEDKGRNRILSLLPS